MKKVVLFLCCIVLIALVFFIFQNFDFGKGERPTETPLPNDSPTSGLLVAEPSRKEGEEEFYWYVGQKVGLHWAGRGLTTEVTLVMIDAGGVVVDELSLDDDEEKSINEFGGSYVYTVPQKLEGRQVRFQVTQKAQDGKILMSATQALITIKPMQ